MFAAVKAPKMPSPVVSTANLQRDDHSVLWQRLCESDGAVSGESADV